MLEFRLLGPLEVTSDGNTVGLAGQRQRALLALLLVRAGELVPSERLIDELWGEQPPRTATTSLQNSISQLRKLSDPTSSRRARPVTCCASIGRRSTSTGSTR